MNNQETRRPIFLRRSMRRAPGLSSNGRYTTPEGALTSGRIRLQRSSATNIEQRALPPPDVGTSSQGERSRQGSNGIKLQVVLNFPPQGLPPRTHFEAGGTSSHNAPTASEVRPHVQPENSMPLPMDDEDNCVIISSAAEFKEGKANSGRNSTIALDSEGQSNTSKRARALFNQEGSARALSNQEGSSDAAIDNAQGVTMPPPPPPPPPKEHIFICPICTGPIVQAMATKCGHIFCRECISQSLDAQGKCPVCMKHARLRHCIEIHLPGAN